MILDIMITNGIVVTMEGPGTGIILNGAVGIKGTEIAAVGETEELLKKHTAHRYIKAKNKAVLPGFINAHLHSSDGIGRGTAQDVEDWLYNIWPVLLNAGDEAVKLGSMVSLVELLKSGTTTICDMSNNIYPLIDNHVKLGTRAVVAEMIHEMPKSIIDLAPLDLYEFDHAQGNKKFMDNIAIIENFHGYDQGRIWAKFGPQALDMISFELLREIYDAAEKYNVGIHMHVAQDSREDVMVEKRHGLRTIPFLKEKGMLNRRLQAVHMIDAKPEEMKAVVDAGGSMVLCPNSVPLACGILPPGEEFMGMGGFVGLGSDTPACNNKNNMFNEMRMCSIMNKMKHQNGIAMPAWKSMRLATIEGAKAIGMDHIIGSIKEGKKADITLVDLEMAALTPIIENPIRNIIPNLVYAANGSEVEMVIVNGKVVVENHKVTTLDEDKLFEDTNKAVKKFQDILITTANIDKLPTVELTQNGYY